MTKQPVAPTPTRRHRFHVLDGLRGLAAIMVIPRHVEPLWATPMPFTNNFLAVDFFFCLSGFVIGFAYEKRLEQGLSLRDFAVIRLIRLYPLYLLGTILSVLLVPTAPHLISSLQKLPVLRRLLGVLPPFFLVPNLALHWIGSLFPLNLPAWSLFLELVTNIVYAVLVRKRLASSVLLITACLISLSELLFFPSNRFSLDSGGLRYHIIDGIARTVLSFGLGILLYRVFSRQNNSHFRGTRAWVALVLVTTALFSVLAAKTHLTSSRTFCLITVVVIFPTLIWFGAQIDLPKKGQPICNFLGDISYPLYIMHFPFLMPFNSNRMMAMATQSPVFAHFALPIAIALLLVICWAAAQYYDTPIRRSLAKRYDHWVASTS